MKNKLIYNRVKKMNTVGEQKRISGQWKEG